MKERVLIVICLLASTACSDRNEACESLRIGMTKGQVEGILGQPAVVHTYDAKSRPSDLYRDVSVYTYKEKFPFAEPNVVFIANRENEVIYISCQDKPIRLRADGTYVDEFYTHRWRIDKNPPANKKVTAPQ